MKDFVVYVARALVDQPDEIVVTEVVGRQSSILELRCHPQDFGRLIGRSGKTIGALRTLVSSLALRQSRRAILEVAE